MKTTPLMVRGASPLWRCLAFLCLSLLVAGCSATSSTTSTMVQSTATPDTSPLTLQNAWGNVTISHFTSKQDGLYEFLTVDCATPDGKYLVGTLKPRDFAKPTQLPSFLSVYDIANSNVIKLRQLQRTTSQILATAADEHWIAWTEIADLTNLTDWTFSARNRQTGEIIQIAKQGRDGQGNLITTPAPTFGISLGHLVWDDSDGTAQTAGNNSNAVIKMRDMTTGKVTLLGKGIFHPNISWPWVYWSQSASSGGGILIAQNMATKDRYQSSAQTMWLGVSSTSIAYIETDNHIVHTIDDVTQPNAHPKVVYQLSSTSGEFVEASTINQRLIGWTAGSENQVWDRLFNRLVTIPTTYRQVQVYIRVLGPLLVWYDNVSDAEVKASQDAGLEPPVTYYVIDTRTLPTKIGG